MTTCSIDFQKGRILRERRKENPHGLIKAGKQATQTPTTDYPFPTCCHLTSLPPTHSPFFVYKLPPTNSSHSNIRQVPDNQEVYLDGDGFSSIVVEILERVEQNDEGRALDDKGALEYHLRDLVEDEEDDAAEKTRVWSTADAIGAKLP